MKCGIFPFWFWNGNQQEDEITRQIKLIAESGCRGVIIHARTGNQTEYMSKRWIELIRHACAEATKADIKVWLYDEDGFPSGNAGGRVQKENPSLVQKSLHFEYAPSAPNSDAFASFDASSFKLVDERVIPEGTDVLRFKIATQPWHIDTFNPESCRLFMRFTHDKYATALKDCFGDSIEAVYTDDESFLCCCIDALPWSGFLEKAYFEKYGENLRDALPLLVEDLPGYEDIRLRFYTLAQKLFLDNFILPQKKWTSEFGLKYTGHLSCDEGPVARKIRAFSSPMPYMSLEDIPAIDDFLADLNDQRYLKHSFNDDRSFLGADLPRAPLPLYKAASSVAHQSADDWLSSEAITYLGWDREPGFLDRQVMFEIGMGVNLITPHAFYYSVGNGTRNDCPPSYSFQQPYFEMLGHMLKKWTLSAELMRRGKFFASTLLIYPSKIFTLENGSEICPKFKLRHPTANGSLNLGDVEKKFCDLVKELHCRHIGFDFGDELLMKSGTYVENSLLHIGDMSYSNVILPDGIDIMPETKELLNQFRADGGNILHAGEISSLDSDISFMCNSDEILTSTRIVDGHKEYMLVNLSGAPAKLSLKLSEPLSVYDPDSMTICHTGTELPNGFTMPRGSACHLLSPDFQARHVSFEDSSFCHVGLESPAELVSISMNADNIYAVQSSDKISFTLADGAVVKRIYCENLPREIIVNGETKRLIESEAHPCDPCYKGADVTGIFTTGENCVEFPKDTGIVYFAGNFLVDGHNLYSSLSTEMRPGDLSEIGYPFYWGSILYKFRFTGRATHLKIILSGGMAQVSVNNRSCGFATNTEELIPISDACGPTENIIEIKFANTASNFICAKRHSFGVFNAMILK